MSSFGGPSRPQRHHTLPSRLREYQDGAGQSAAPGTWSSRPDRPDGVRRTKKPRRMSAMEVSSSFAAEAAAAPARAAAVPARAPPVDGAAIADLIFGPHPGATSAAPPSLLTQVSEDVLQLPARAEAETLALLQELVNDEAAIAPASDLVGSPDELWGLMGMAVGEGGDGAPLGGASFGVAAALPLLPFGKPLGRELSYGSELGQPMAKLFVGGASAPAGAALGLLDFDEGAELGLPSSPAGLTDPTPTGFGFESVHSLASPNESASSSVSASTSASASPSRAPTPAPASFGAQPPAAAPASAGRNVAERKDWTSAEDVLISSSVALHGCKWRVIAAQLPGRSDDAVRNRWNRLREIEHRAAGGPAGSTAGLDGGGAPLPALGKPPSRTPSSAALGEGAAPKPERVSWSRGEDETIMTSVAEIGHKWSQIVKRLPGRTEHAIRNRFARLQSLAGPAPAAPSAAAAAPAASGADAAPFVDFLAPSMAVC